MVLKSVSLVLGYVDFGKEVTGVDKSTRILLDSSDAVYHLTCNRIKDTIIENASLCSNLSTFSFEISNSSVLQLKPECKNQRDKFDPSGSTRKENSAFFESPYLVNFQTSSIILIRHSPPPVYGVFYS